MKRDGEKVPEQITGTAENPDLFPVIDEFLHGQRQKNSPGSSAAASLEDSGQSLTGRKRGFSEIGA